MASEDPRENSGASQANSATTPPAPSAAAPTADAAAAPALKPAVRPTAAPGAPTPAKATPAQPTPPARPPRPQPVDEFDPVGWDVPIVCKDCGKDFSVPYRHFHAGVVFHCPHCNGSWVPNTTIARGTRRVFEEFWGARKRAREAFERGELKVERGEFERRQAAELEVFRGRLKQLAQEMKPAGKLVRPKGLAAMFT
ncbi:MAG TPA: hypothetical protein VFB33_03570 [Candidatus Binataceae bacterium]|nr:hypothetical protein [Candidatus Binataceae bacterium]